MRDPTTARLLPARGRRARDGRLRARPGAVGRSTASPPTSTAGCCPRTGTRFERADDERDRARALARGRRGGEADQRPGGVHAGRRVHPRRRPTSAASGSRPASARTGSPAPAAMGKLVAEWIVDGRPSFDTWKMDSAASARTTRAATTRSRAPSRCTRPTTTSSTRARSGRPGRPLRRLPGLRSGCASSAACSARRPAGSAPNWFAPNEAAGDESLRPRGWAGGHWSPGDRRRAPRLPRDARRSSTRPRFSKMDVTGAGRGRVPRAPVRERVDRAGRTRHVHADAERRGRGRVRPHRHPTRPTTLPLVTGTAFGSHDLALDPRSTRPETARCTSSDVTSRVGVLRDLGAARRATILRRSPTPTSRTTRSRTCTRASIAVGPAPCLAVRVTYVGRARLGALLPDRVRRRALCDALWDAGAAARPRRRRLQGDRLAAAREGLPRLGRGHHPRRHALRGRSRLRRQARQG